jgi:hypothetical protein
VTDINTDKVLDWLTTGRDGDTSSSNITISTHGSSSIRSTIRVSSEAYATTRSTVRPSNGGRNGSTNRGSDTTFRERIRSPIRHE